MKRCLRIMYYSFFGVATLVGRFHLIQKAVDFDRMLQKYDYSIACFTFSTSSDYLKTSESELQLQYSFDQIKNRMIAASKKENYVDLLSKNIGFLMVDLSKPGNKKLLKDFALIFTEFPCLMLFDQDALVQVLVKIPQSATEIIKILDQQFGKNITKLIQNYGNAQMTPMPNYYQYEGTPYAWYPYAVWPYSRWGIRPYEVGYGLELAEYT